ncbi:MAG: hypothetical protein IM486_09640 [Microcystis sp. M114S2]|uniref:hypothetical protein n=1 Tax=Microcystis TaxID=1125 RepID=UPI00123162CC|nr:MULTISPECIES: hypothetical protein [Microcystis]MDJ0530641.1 hypothetical protein [Microcystis sp. M53600_WE12]NCR75315.1 hypothetical protein [Microcystis aeruginosa K13-06]MCA2667697.1 hypothetical protein [Microcystis sp. M045S2]MCA2713679.1 hypothetical protein [Microcystis sp. M172S2]MCA2804312.1 hypothetical protein [Microcystis sp. M114S2]
MAFLVIGYFSCQETGDRRRESGVGIQHFLVRRLFLFILPADSLQRVHESIIVSPILFPTFLATKLIIGSDDTIVTPV